MISDSPQFPTIGHGDSVRLSTLINLRWLAVLGQTATLVFASFYLSLRVELGLCFLAVGSSVIANLLAMTIFPANQRLSEGEALLTLLFDIAQLSFLLFLTGGLHNPFALLFVVPVTISATALSPRATILLGAISIILISLLALYHLPLRTQQGFVLRIPDIFLFGFWVSIVVGTIFLAAYAYRVTKETRVMSQALLATQMALAREQKLTDLGGVVAAAAHELGTPLATIKLTSAELVDDLADRPDLMEDAQLIRDQADRCRDILRSMGRAGKDDLHMRTAPLSGVIKEAAEPHADRGIAIHYDIAAQHGADTTDPLLLRKPELIHGLRNLVQNAVDFAREQIWIDAQWTQDSIQIRVIDDGEGYPPNLIGRIGDPFLRRRKSARDASARPGYEGMGLGLFIAKTLLERTGAKVTFANASDPFLTPEERPTRSGAVVEVVWPHDAIAVQRDASAGPLGENVPFDSLPNI